MNLALKELVDTLDGMIAGRERVEDPRQLLLDVGERVARVVAAQFRTQPDEVAILLLTSDGKHLRFVAPRKLSDLGTIPVTKRDSIAVSILTRKTPDVQNNVRMVKHVAFFESVKLRERAVPIQKMVSVPILHDGKAVGVAQLSRKGETPSEAGPDFSEADGRKALEVFEAVGRHLVEARPERF